MQPWTGAWSDLEFGDFGGLPELKADLFIDWGWDIVDGAAEPTIELRNLRIDVGVDHRFLEADC